MAKDLGVVVLESFCNCCLLLFRSRSNTAEKFAPLKSMRRAALVSLPVRLVAASNI